MNKNNISIEDSQNYVVFSIIILYLLLEGFILYFFCLHKIGFVLCAFLSIVLFLFYIPRFLIIKRIAGKVDIKIIENFLVVDGIGYSFEDLIDYKIEAKKPVLIFFLNGKMVVFNEYIFHVRFRSTSLSFNIFTKQKADLLITYFDNVLK